MDHEGNPEIPVPQRFKIARIIGASFLGALGMYALLVYLIRLPATAAPPGPVDPAFRASVWAASLAMIAGGLILTERLIPRPATPTDNQLAGMLVTRMIVRLAFFDAAAMCGLYVFFESRDWTDFALLAAIAAALTLARQPTRAEWLAESRAAGLSWSL